jgi:hypothetical protein
VDVPITDVILRHYHFVEQTEAGLAPLEAEHDSARADAQRRQRERRRLQPEVDTLKQNLALTAPRSTWPSVSSRSTGACSAGRNWWTRSLVGRDVCSPPPTWRA